MPLPLQTESPSVDLQSVIEANLAERGLIPDRSRILVAVSGGVDSVVLLDLLHRLSFRRGFKLVVGHFNHRLRGRSSAADARFVQKKASELGVHFELGESDVRGAARAKGLSIEMAARDARHAFLASTARRLGVRRVALAHHADDQVELFFLRLMRGTSPQGLGGMRWSNPSPSDPRVTLIRPLLGLTRQALRGYATKQGLVWREDQSNADPTLVRNRVRNRLLPFVERNFRPTLARSIPRLMEVLRAEHDLVQIEAAKIRSAGGELEFERVPVAIQREMIHVELLRLGIDPSFELIERLRAAPSRAVTAPDGVILARSHNRVRCLDPTPGSGFQGKSTSVHLRLEGRAGEVLFGGKRFRWKKVRGAVADRIGRRGVTAGVEWFDAERIGDTVTLRYWLPGDRFQPIGMKHPVKLQDMFINKKIARGKRHSLVIAIASDGRPFWVEELRISELYKLDKNTLHLLKWEWNPVSGLR